MRRAALSGTSASARNGVRPLDRSAGIMRPVPLWRFAPFRAPAAFDVNLCTDSVLPGTIAPVRLRCAWVLWPLLSGIPLEIPDGAVPCPCFTASFFNSDRPDCLSCRLCPPIEGFISCRRPGNSPAESPGYYRRRPIASAFFRRSPGIFAKKLCSANLACSQGLRADAGKDSVFPEPSCALPVILIHEAAHADVHHDTQRQERKQDRRSSIAH